jgi:hypothetical protein
MRDGMLNRCGVRASFNMRKNARRRLKKSLVIKISVFGGDLRDWGQSDCGTRLRDSRVKDRRRTVELDGLREERFSTTYDRRADPR